MGRPSLADLHEWSDKHWATTQLLMDAGNEWAAVTGFYSCYHLLRAAMMQEPLFDQPIELSRVHHTLQSGDRYETKHSLGGLNKAALGMKEICTVVYPHIAPRYYLAHDASNGIRYDGGLPRHIKTVDAALEQCRFFRDEYFQGRLTHSQSVVLKAAG